MTNCYLHNNKSKYTQEICQYYHSALVEFHNKIVCFRKWHLIIVKNYTSQQHHAIFAKCCHCTSAPNTDLFFWATSITVISWVALDLNSRTAEGRKDVRWDCWDWASSSCKNSKKLRQILGWVEKLRQSRHLLSTCHQLKSDFFPSLTQYYHSSLVIVLFWSILIADEAPKGEI